MIGMMERNAAMLAFPKLPEGKATVGFEVCIKHVAAAIEGARARSGRRCARSPTDASCASTSRSPRGTHAGRRHARAARGGGPAVVTGDPHPVIGICAAVEQARWGAWDMPSYLLPRNYIDAIQRGGGLALMLPPDPRVTEDPDQVLDLLDGLILAGGADMDPSTYGAERHPATDHGSIERDEFELALARRAMERDIPFLGICRGMQVMNVARGGTLVQDVPEREGHDEHRRVRGTFEGADHDVKLRPGSLASRAAGEEHHAAKSHHHQGVDRHRRGARGHRLGGDGRAAGGARGHRAPLRARRPVASGGRRGEPADLRAGRRGRGAPRGGRAMSAAAVAHALAYPFGIPSGSYLLAGGQAVALNGAGADADRRAAVLAFGANASPAALAAKLGDRAVSASVPVVAGELHGFDVVHSAHVSPYGSIPGTLQHSPGAVASVHVVHLLPEELAAVHRSEPNYVFARLSGIDLRLEGGEGWTPCTPT